MVEDRQQVSVLLMSVFIISICSITYELIIGTLSSYLFGNSVLYFSLTIGLFMSAMGLGSYLSRFIETALLPRFILLEMTIGLVGGASAILLYSTFATTNLYHVAMVSLILVIGGCIGVEIPLLTRLTGGWATLKENLADVLAFDYLGALVGSVMFPFILLPQLGLLQTAFIMGLLNMLVVILNLWIFRAHISRIGLYWLGSIAITAMLLSGIGYATQLTDYFEQRLYGDTIIYAEQTRYQRIIVTRYQDDVRLYLDGNLQFSTIDEYRYHEPLVHPAMNLSRSRESVLILGGGDGLVVRELRQYVDIERIVMVDLDPNMVELARTHPAFRAVNQDSLTDPRLEVINEDAFNYLANNTERFGVIIIDLPDPNNEALAKLYSREFYTLVQRHLGQGGVMVTQATSPYFAREAFWSIAHTMKDSGLQVYPYHIYIPSFGDWGYVMAAAHPLEPSRFAPEHPLRYLTPTILEQAFLFDSDTAELDVEVSTLDFPKILDYYQRGWERWN